jgi:hypothetical protein
MLNLLSQEKILKAIKISDTEAIKVRPREYSTETEKSIQSTNGNSIQSFENQMAYMQ